MLFLFKISRFQVQTFKISSSNFQDFKKSSSNCQDFKGSQASKFSRYQVLIFKIFKICKILKFSIFQDFKSKLLRFQDVKFKISKFQVQFIMIFKIFKILKFIQAFLQCFQVFFPNNFFMIVKFSNFHDFKMKFSSSIYPDP